MKIILDIPDHEVAFALKVLKSLSFVKNARPMSASAVDLVEELEESADQVRQHKKGKLKLKSAYELLNEL